jgi:hypothetical protein
MSWVEGDPPTEEVIASPKSIHAGSMEPLHRIVEIRRRRTAAGPDEE